MKAEIDSRARYPKDSDARSIHTNSLSNAFLSFSMMDYVSIMGLGYLDMVGIRQLCVVDDLADDALIGTAGGGGPGVGDDGAVPGGGGVGADGSDEAVGGSDNVVGS